MAPSSLASLTAACACSSKLSASLASPGKTATPIELVKNKQTRERYPEELAVGMVCRGHCFANGLVMRAVGDTMIIAPPLVISRAEIDELVSKARLCLDLTLQQIQA